MTTRHVIELDTAFFLLVAATVGVAVALYTNHSPKKRISFSLPAVAQQLEKQMPFVSPSPSPAPPFAPVTQTFSHVSPDGAKTLTMSVTTNKDTTKTFAFTASDSLGFNKQPIYSATLPSTENMTVPFNTWSPDDKYVFLQADRASDSGALVMRADGKDIVSEQQYLNVTSLFNQRGFADTYKVTTGWASETLLIIETTKADGTDGTSYWFEVPSKAIIPLSTQF